MNRAASRGGWLVTLSLVAGSIAYLVFVFLPGQKLTAELNAQIEEKQAYLARVETITAALIEGEKELQRTNEYREQWRTNAPNATHISEFFAKIHDVERTSGVEVLRFEPRRVLARECVAEVPLSLGCAGTFAQVFTLLRGLEQLPADVWVKKMRLEKEASDRNYVQCEMDLVIFADNCEKSDYVKNSN